MRFAYFDGKTWQLSAVRLEPGILENGKIKDRDKLKTALVALKSSLKIGRDKKKKVSVVATLGSASIYSQVLSLPMLGGENLKNAVELNLQMASPGDMAKSYSSWQVVAKNDATAKLDVLSSFIDREVVDDMVQMLFETGFITVALETRAVALARILREKGGAIDFQKAYLLLEIDDIGIDFFIIRNSEPYFEYSTTWHDIADEKGEITMPKFKTELVTSLRQVLNFYTQHWIDPIGGVIVSTVLWQEEIENAVSVNASLPVVRLTLEMGQPISSEWLIAIGCSLRGEPSSFGESAINLLGEEWQDEFQEHQMIGFIKFWQVLVSAALAVLILCFGFADGFLQKTQAGVESGGGFTATVQQGSDMAALTAQASVFNASVAALQSTESSIHPKGAIIADLESLASARNIAISRMSFTDNDGSVSLSGISPSEDDIVAFKTDLEADSRVSSINLPLTGIQQSGNTFSFSMTLMYAP